MLSENTTAEMWHELTSRTVTEIGTVDGIYQPTNFWGPALDRLLADEKTRGLDTFKSWPSSRIWYYPVYGTGFSSAMTEQLIEFAQTLGPKIDAPWLTGTLIGARDAHRDFDAARLDWDQQRWPFDHTAYGESLVGKPPQYFRMTKEQVGWTRPYLNYLLCLSALSHHVDTPPRSVLEIGGGYGVLGEILLSRDPGARYVNLDIPPLLTVSSYYLTELFGHDKVRIYTDEMTKPGPLEIEGSAVLPNWRVKDVKGDFDLFVNAFSFQEMEPDVVAHYIEAIADTGVEFVVSYNSRHGKPQAHHATDSDVGGVIEPVTSQHIVDLFGARGYQALGRYGAPLVASAAEIAVLRRS